MKTIHVVLKGVTPLLMNNCQCVNPLHPITIAKKKISDKGSKNRTDEDNAMLSDLEWEGSLYWDDTVGLYIPAENIEAVVRDGAKAVRKGKDIVRFFSVVDMFNPLDTGEELTFEQMKSDYRFRDVRQMKVQRSRVTRTRGRFNRWQVSFRAMYDETQIDLQTIVDAVEYAGKYVGLCDSRPKYGKFVASIEEVA